MRRDPDALIRARARRDRDDQALRLREVVPGLQSLKLQIEEHPKGPPNGVPEPPKSPPKSALKASLAASLEPKMVAHVKHIIVDRAPARFELPCCDHKCDGSHDITGRVLAGLQGGKTSFTGKHTCAGTGKEGACSFELRFTVMATYTG